MQCLQHYACLVGSGHVEESHNITGNILPGRGRNGVFSGNYVFDMVAVLIDFGICKCTRNFDT
jgi:hypothetical protein